MTGTLRADDRVLLLAIPHPNELAAISRVLMRGVLVALGTREEVDNARQAMAEFENIMFIEAAPDRIPWRDAYFTKIIIPPHLETLHRLSAPEVSRLLAPGGAIVKQTADA